MLCTRKDRFQKQFPYVLSEDSLIWSNSNGTKSDRTYLRFVSSNASNVRCERARQTVLTINKSCEVIVSLALWIFCDRTNLASYNGSQEWVVAKTLPDKPNSCLNPFPNAEKSWLDTVWRVEWIE